MRRRPRRGRFWLRLVGELDVDTAHRLADALEPLYAQQVTTVVLDLSALGFIDSSGLRQLVLARQRQHQLGGKVVLHAPRDHIRRVLEIVGLTTLFDIS